MIDALRRASARRITAVIPYFGYARQDRKTAARTPISAKLVANLITHAGVDRVLTVDLHAGQIQGFFDIPTDNLFGAPVMVRDIKERMNSSDKVVVSPDVGGVVRARAIAKRIDAPLAIVDKRRERAGESEVMNIIGDVSGRFCVLIDDIVDSAGTLCNAAAALRAGGAAEVVAYCTHGVLSGEAVSRVQNSALRELVITDSIAAYDAAAAAGGKIRILTVAPLLAEAIRDVTRPGEIVLDAFSGSGSTILACEQSKRIGYAVEIEPGYIDVAIRRWEKMTGKQALLEASGTTFRQVQAERTNECLAA